MKRTAGLGLGIAALLLAACAGPPVVGTARGPFDTVNGLYGGNEFSPLSPEGKRDFKGDASAAPATAPAPANAAPTVAAAPVPPVALAAAAPSAPAPAPVAAIALERINIDANAYGAVFGTTPGPVKPTPTQLMQLDSLSLVTAEPLRVDLQKKILACRRAGDYCRLAAQ